MTVPINSIQPLRHNMNSNEIYNLMMEKSINVHYTNRYMRFIRDCSEANRILPKDSYTEQHHILPKAKEFWPEFANLRKNTWNSTSLTARQHLIAHHILAKALGGSMWVALWSMVNGKCSFYRPNTKIDSRLFALARENHSINHSEAMIKHYNDNPDARKAISDRTRGERNPFYGKHHTEEVREHLSLINTGKTLSEEVKAKISNGLLALGRTLSDDEKKVISERQKGESNSFFGRTHTEESRKKISAANKGRPSEKKGKPLSEEHKLKISQSQSGICRNKEVTCPHCGKVGKSSGMGTWHFDKCRMKGA